MPPTAILRGLAMTGALLAAGCGGGGGAGSSPPPPPPAPSTLAVAVASSSLENFGRQNASETTLSVDIRQSGSTTAPIVPSVTYDATLLTLQGSTTLSGDIYRLTFKSRNDLPLGDYTGTIGFRLCHEAACSNVHPNTTLSLPFKVSVVVADWSTFQRDAGHTGYVGVTVDPARIAKLWDYSPPNSIGLGRVAADPWRVYVSTYTGGAYSLGTVAAVSLKDGREVWRGTAGPMSHIGEPAVHNGRMIVSIMDTSSPSNPTFIVNAETGTQQAIALYASQSARAIAATVVDEEIFQAAGYYGNDVYSFNLVNGAERWKSHGSGYNAWFTQTPAADGQFVYFYNGEGLDVFRRSNGSLATSIPDPAHGWNGYDYWGAPMLPGDGSVVAFSGTTGGAQVLDTSYDVSRPLVRFLPTTSGIAWTSADRYRTTPAVRGDLVFAARNDPARLDALNLRDGTIAWSWTPPAGSKFRSNIVVTDNVLFVGTTTQTFGLSLADRSVLWTHTAPGALAIAPGNILLVSEANLGDVLLSNNRLSAFRLR